MGTGIFSFDDDSRRLRAGAVIARMPVLRGASIRIHSIRGLRDREGPVHGGAFLRERRIALDCTRAEFPRILAHEVAHFIWLRLGNAKRLAYEAMLRGEIEGGARGELGWSAQHRKDALGAHDIAGRSRRWREYCCESFCDSAAWLYSGVAVHPEFTLAGKVRRRRAEWWERVLGRGPLPV
jgi:hypothetical protein